MMLGALGGLLGLGCSLFSGPPETIVYDLTRIAGNPLPAPEYEGVDVKGNTFAFVVHSGTLTLFSDKAYVLEGTVQRTENDVPIEQPQHFERNRTYRRTGKEVILQAGDPEGDPIRYQILEGGRVLRGVEFTGKVFEFVRRDSP